MKMTDEKENMYIMVIAVLIFTIGILAGVII